jgi:hypothetical protein
LSRLVSEKLGGDRVRDTEDHTEDAHEPLFAVQAQLVA